MAEEATAYEVLVKVLRNVYVLLNGNFVTIDGSTDLTREEADLIDKILADG
jgi:hypothetical protein